MAFPRLFQKLFQNDGASSMLRTDIIPLDSALSTISLNGVQNKIINAAVEKIWAWLYPVGFIGMYGGTDVPDGWFRCDGSTIADMQTNYPKLYAVLGTNVLPNYSDRVPFGATSDINGLVGAGLPNITGSVGLFRFFGLSSPYVSGAFTYLTPTATGSDPADTYPAAADVAYKTRSNKFGIDASVSNAIYGRSSTVQPPAIKVAVLIKHD